MFIKFRNVNSAEDGNSDFNPDSEPLDRQKIHRYGQDTRHRRNLVYWVMIIIPLWLASVLVIIVWTNIDMMVKNTLLITTTANVIGLALIVLNGLFAKNDNG